MGVFACVATQFEICFLKLVAILVEEYSTSIGLTCLLVQVGLHSIRVSLSVVEKLGFVVNNAFCEGLYR